MAIAATSATTSTSIDVNSIVSQLMTVERQPVNKLNAQEAGYQAKLSAYGSVKSTLSSLQSAAIILSSAAQNKALSASSSDSTSISASANSTAATGAYSVDVSALAQAQRLVASGQASQSTAIGTGTSTTLSFDMGTISGGTFNAPTGLYTGASFDSNGSGIKTVTIDSSNNTLEGIRDAINKANIGVSASIINDGGTSPYRLVLSSSSTGKSNSMKISVTGDATLSSLLSQDPAAAQNLSETTTAQNAALKINGIAISKPTNVVTDAIPGVTLNLSKTTTATTNITVAADNSAMTTAINGFVKAYNDVAKTLANVTAYNPAAKQGAILQGDTTIRTLQTQLRGLLSTTTPGASGTYSTLSSVGVSFQRDGSLTVDTAKLGSALSSGFNNVASLFGAVGNTSDNLVSYSSASNNTQPGTYGVNITQIATQGNMQGTTAVAPSTTITSGSNDGLTLTVNGLSVSITLAAGTYTPQTLATEVQNKINASAALTSASTKVSTGIDLSGMLTITSSTYGSASSIIISGGSSSTDLFGAAPTVATSGLDVAGTIGDAAATGSGQTLTSSSGNATGLVISVTGGNTGLRGTVSYSQGYATKLNNLTTSLLANDGLLAGRTNGINNTIKDIGQRRDALIQRLSGIEANYRKQYSALDVMLTSFNQTSTYLTQQLARL